MIDSRICVRPKRILCQHENGGCAACCGIYNFKDRSKKAHKARVDRRTALVEKAGFDISKLTTARDKLVKLEKPDMLFANIKVCPFAGWIEPKRLGCLIHPVRHPDGLELRELSVYESSKICDGHFCAPHDWLNEVEKDLAQTTPKSIYGQMVTDAGFVKALVKMIESRLFRPLKKRDVALAGPGFSRFWQMVEDWPWRGKDVNRFGRFFAGEDGSERLVSEHVDEALQPADRQLRLIFECLESKFASKQELKAAAELFLDRIEKIAREIENR